MPPEAAQLEQELMEQAQDPLAGLNELAGGRDLQVVKLAEMGGEYAIMFVYRPADNPTYEKYFTSVWRKDLTELIALVRETLEDDMNIFSSNLFEYLSGEMIGDKSITLTIKDVAEETLTSSRGKDDKPVVTFMERKKKWVLNKTSARELADRLGPETTEWRGHRVVLHTETVPAFGRSVKAIRIKNILPPVEAAKVAKPIVVINGKNSNPPPFADEGGLNGRVGAETLRELVQWGVEAHGPDWDGQAETILERHGIDALGDLTEVQAQAILAGMKEQVG